MKKTVRLYTKNIQVDQSGKIEQTNINTVLALSNGKILTIVFRKKNKSG